MGYMDPQNPIGVPRSQHEGRLSCVGTMGKRSVTLDADAFQKTHFTVIQQLHLITPFTNEHKWQLREDNPDCGRAWLAKMHMQGFSRWLQDYVKTCSNNVVLTDEIRNLATGHCSLLQDTKQWIWMDTHSTPWHRIKRASIKIVVGVYGPSSTTVMMMMTRCWRSISVNQEHLLCYGLNFILELTRH
jgi:hypothetical protein